MGKKIYVGNLSYNTTEEDLADHFAQYGEVTSCKIITDKMTDRSKGFAFVEMGSDSEAQDAIAALDGKEFMQRNLKVNEARPQPPRSGGGGGGDRGRGRY